MPVFDKTLVFDFQAVVNISALLGRMPLTIVSLNTAWSTRDYALPDMVYIFVSYTTLFKYPKRKTHVIQIRSSGFRVWEALDS